MGFLKSTGEREQHYKSKTMLHEKNMDGNSVCDSWLWTFCEPADFSGLWMRSRQKPDFVYGRQIW